MIPELLHTAVFHLDLSLLLVISNTSYIWILIFFLCLLIMGSALVSGSEVAYFSLSPDDLHNLEKENSRSASIILRLRSKPRKLLATILISNNLINIAIVIFSHFLVQKLIAEETLLAWGTSISDLFGRHWIKPAVAGNTVHFLITVVGVTFILVLFGEVAPKIYAKLNNIKLSKIMSGPFVFLNGLFTPISSLLVNSSNWIERRLQNRQPEASRDWKEIDSAIELAMSTGSQSESEVDLLKSILKFSKVSVTQIMTPRVDVASIDQTANFEEVMELVKSGGISRIPVYRETFDNVTGILYAKDLIRYVDKPADFNWQKFIRTDIIYAPESKKISDLLQEFQEKKMHLAIVVDEYGGSSGVATLEDIMEEVVGEIRDEFEDEEDEIEFVKVDENTFIFEGKVLLNDVLRIMEENPGYFDKVRGDADSMAGLILELTGKMPKLNHEIAIGKYLMRVMSVSKRRIEQVRVNRREKLL